MYTSENISKTPLKIILADNNKFFRHALKSLIEIQFDFEIIGEASENQELKDLPCVFEASLILIDINLPDSGGCYAAKILNWENPKCRLLAVAILNIEKLIKHGFTGCLIKDNLYNQLIEAVSSVLNGKLFFPKAVSDYPTNTNI